MPLSEEELVQRLIARDPQAMTEFYGRYRASSYVVVNRIVRNPQCAEDMLQEGMLKVWRSMDVYDAAQSRLFSWAAKICCNTAIDYIRSGRYRLVARSTSLTEALPTRYVTTAGFNPEHIGVPELLRPLRPQYRRLLELLCLHGYTHAEAAEELNVPLGTVKTWSASAKLQLLDLRTKYRI